MKKKDRGGKVAVTSRGQRKSTMLLLQGPRLFVPPLKLYNGKDNPHLRLHLGTENLLI